MGPSVSSGAGSSARLVRPSNQLCTVNFGVVGYVALCVLEITSSA